MTLKDSILKYALQNAVKFNGKANPGAIVGKLIQENPEIKKDMKSVSKQINEIIKEISNMSVEEQETKLREIAPELLEKKVFEKKEGLKELKNAEKGKVVMRLAPSPSGPMHLGHSYPFSLNSEYCKKYDGKFILRIEDTNPENIYEPAYGMLPEDAKWLSKDNVAEVIIQSDRLGLYYDYAEKLVDMGKSYVCDCDPDHFKQLIFEKKECPCRMLPVEEQQKRYAKMFGEYKPGEVVLRLKTDITHKNPAMRDFPLMRINDHVHPRKGTEYRAWPLMNLAVFVDDVELGMTHIIRAKDHMDNAKRQEWLYKYFNKPVPETIFVGKINFSDLKLSCSETKKLIQEGKYDDWSDIRLFFIPALKRRGYQPDAFIKYAVEVGTTQNDKTVSKEEFFKSLNHFNKEVLDPISKRYFFVEDPAEILIHAAPSQNVELNLHPDNENMGKRKFSTEKRFYISKDDHDSIEEGEFVRLMDCLNFKKNSEDEFAFVSTDYEEYKEKGKKIIHWLPVSDDLVEVEILMPDKTLKKGLAESGVKDLKKGDVIQFERTGFCRLDDKKDDKLVFWFGHK